MDPLIETQRELIIAVARRHGVKRVRVFGSMARGDADAQSDIDLLVEVDEATSGLELGALLIDLEELLGRRVEIVTEAALHPLIRQRVLEEAVPL